VSQKRLWQGINVDELPLFPYEIRGASKVPDFVTQFLDSGYIVNWMDFDVWDVWIIRDFLLHLKNKSDYSELYTFLLWDEEYGYKDRKYFQRPEYDPFQEMKFTTGQIERLLKLTLPALDEIKAFHRQHYRYPFNLTIDFNLPPIYKNRKISAENIIRKIRYYGANSEQIHQHLHSTNPERRCYRGSIHLEFPDLIAEFIHKTIPGRRMILVPVINPQVTAKSRVEVWISYPPDFTGYFLHSFDCIAPTLVED